VQQPRLIELRPKEEVSAEWWWCWWWMNEGEVREETEDIPIRLRKRERNGKTKGRWDHNCTRGRILSYSTNREKDHNKSISRRMLADGFRWFRRYLCLQRLMFSSGGPFIPSLRDIRFDVPQLESKYVLWPSVWCQLEWIGLAETVWRRPRKRSFCTDERTIR